MSAGDGDPRSTSGQQLWRLLPEVYRSRDNGDLASVVDGMGEVLDLLRGVIQQRIADSFPDHPSVQGWVLPYLADLLDARLVSPDDDGRRQEIARASAWRKTKGTMDVVGEIVDTLGAFGWTDGDPAQRPARPVVIEEGWQRVVTTPRAPLVAPANAPTDRRALIRDASLPMGTVDLRSYSRLVAVGGGAAPAPPPTLVQANPHGVPCFPGSSEDRSLRTPDLRTPTWRTGHHHPKRVLIFVVPRAGFFPPGWELVPPQATSGPLLLSNAVVTDFTVDVPGPDPFVIQDSLILGELHVKSGQLTIERSAVRSLVADPIAAPPGLPTVLARDCLFDSFVAAGLVEILGVTVLGNLAAPRCWASDSLLAGTAAIPVPAAGSPATGDDGTPINAFRFSRLPTSLLAGFTTFQCTDAPPYFQSSSFGGSGCGVLLPLSGPALDTGAEDGGEMGAYHHRRYSLRARAVLDKLRDFLPLGQVAVIIPDQKLNCPPPTIESTS